MRFWAYGVVAAFSLSASGCKSTPLALKGRLLKHSGGEISVAELRNKVVVVNFWATWCGPCQREIPDLIEVMKEYGPRGVVLLAADQDGGDQEKEVVEEYLLTHPVAGFRPFVVYPDDAFLSAFDIKGLPTTYVLDGEGKVINSYLGGVRAAQLKQALEAGLRRTKHAG